MLTDQSSVNTVVFFFGEKLTCVFSNDTLVYLTEESNKRPWRPQSSSSNLKMQSSTWSMNETQEFMVM